MRARALTQLDDEAGTVVLWLLGVSVMLLALGGLSIDLWHVLSERRALAGIADAAAYAGASGVDVARYRETGEVVLEPDRAVGLAAASVDVQADAAALVAWEAGLAPDGSRIEVRLVGAVDTALLRLLAPGADRLEIAVTAVAEPRLG